MTKLTKRLNARVPTSVAENLDFVVRNTATEGVTNLSTAIVAALRAFVVAELGKIKSRGIEVPNTPEPKRPKHRKDAAQA